MHADIAKSGTTVIRSWHKMCFYTPVGLHFDERWTKGFHWDHSTLESSCVENALDSDVIYNFMSASPTQSLEVIYMH